MANLGSKGYIEHIDDPAITTVNATPGAGVTWALSSDSSDVAFARAVAVGKGYHYTGATAATNNNMIEFCSNDKIFAAQEGHCYAEIIVQLDVITTAAFFFGFSDDVLDADNHMPVELATTTFTNRAATHCGIVYDVNADNDDLHCHWADGGTNTTTAIASLRMQGMAPTAAKWLYMRVELQDMGSGNGAWATFTATDHNGRSVTKEFQTTVTRSTALCYYFGFENRDAVAHNVYLKAPNWKQSIPDM